MAHGDIKPDNLMLTDELSVAFIDFANLKAIDSITNKSTGTSIYNPPEVLYREDYNAEKVDMF